MRKAPIRKTRVIEAFASFDIISGSVLRALLVGGLSRWMHWKSFVCMISRWRVWSICETNLKDLFFFLFLGKIGQNCRYAFTPAVFFTVKDMRVNHKVWQLNRTTASENLNSAAKDNRSFANGNLNVFLANETKTKVCPRYQTEQFWTVLCGRKNVLFTKKVAENICNIILNRILF